MAYGLKAVNNDSYIQIDSDTPRLCAIHNGKYAASNSNTATVLFPTAITTQEPPCIFLRNSPDRNHELYDMLSILGSAGNWTGFSVRANNVTWRPAGKWFAAVFASQSQSSYGLRLWGGAGEVIYDSSAVAVIVIKANSIWDYKGSVQFPTIGAGYFWSNRLVAPLAEDEYFLMNPFSRGAVNTYGAYHWRGVRFNYSTNNLEMYIIAFPQNPPVINQGNPAGLFARLPGT